MKILFWTPPWIAQGDPVFYRNAIRKHLIPQANLLVSCGHSVHFVLPELIKEDGADLSPTVRVSTLSISDHVAMTGSLEDPSLSLYRSPSGELTDKIASFLKTRLEPNYDTILLWETPVPFLEQLYPEALIAHQMPGTFSRPPYPHTVTFDPLGLYRHGSLHQLSNSLISSPSSYNATPLVDEFRRRSLSLFKELRPFSRQELDPIGRFEKLTLLPLQVTAHYGFLADTHYTSQAQYLLDVLTSTPKSTGVVATQYLSRLVKDSFLTAETAASLSRTWTNLIYLPRFDEVGAVSQYLLGEVDSVTSCSSSLGLQCLLWNLPLHVRGKTFLENYDVSRLSHSDRPVVANSVLSTILTRLNPLASSVTQDATFLSALLEDLIVRKRSGKMGLELLPRFHDLDPHYSHRVLESFRADRAVRDLGSSNAIMAARLNETAKFKKLLRDETLSCITFDVFDTLLRRSTETPVDVYRFFEPTALTLSGGVAEDFARTRTFAEVSARERSKRGEITIDDIYLVLQNLYGLTDKVRDLIRDAEIAFELENMHARPLGRSLYQIAIDSGLPVHLVSDMYLPATVVDSMLRKEGFYGYQRLFVSSTHGVRKKEGGLFDIVLRELSLEGKQVLHVGDNIIADVEKAEARRIRTFRTPRAIDRLRGNTIYKELFSPRSGAGEQARSAIVGTLAHGMFDSAPPRESSHFYGNAYNLGYAGVGPLATGFAIWLTRSALEQGVDHLYFFAREGELLRATYEALRGEGTPNSSYLLVSRRAVRVPALQNTGDVLALASQPFHPGVTLQRLLESRFGLSQTVIDGLTNGIATVRSSPRILGAGAEDRVYFSQICNDLAPQILSHAQEERTALLAYLEETGLANCHRPGVVDVGWKANIQGALGKVTGTTFDGFYIATLLGAERWNSQGHKIHSYFGTQVSTGHPSVIVNNRHLLEYLMCAPSASLVRMVSDGADTTPVFLPQAGAELRTPFIREVHRGAVDFATNIGRDFRRTSLWLDPFLAERILGDFITRPMPCDARMLMGHYFEDALGGVERRYIVAPKANASPADSVWVSGFTAAHQSKGAKKESAAFYNNPPTTQTRRVDLHRPKSSATLHNVERFIVRQLVNPNKARKYDRDRNEFFADSKSPFARAWLRATQEIDIKKS